MHGAVLSRYIILGAVNTFRRRYKLSWDGMNFSLETKQLNSVLFEDIAMSMFFPEDRGDPSRLAVDKSVSGRTILCDLRISLDNSLAPMTSHFDRFKERPKSRACFSRSSKSVATVSAFPPRVMSSRYATTRYDLSDIRSFRIARQK